MYLVFLEIQVANWSSANADAMLATLSTLPLGTTKDLATVARARSLRLHGAPQSALDSLRPLVGKIVDEADREYFLEEVALDAIAAKDTYEGVAYLDAWLRGVGEDDKDRVRTKIEAIAETLPRDVLEETYKSMRASGTQSGYGSDMQKVVAERLAHIAVQTNDAALARWLVEQSGVSAAQTGGDAGVELGELATSKRGLASFAGKHRSALLRADARHASFATNRPDVVRGLSWAALRLRCSARRTCADGGHPASVTRDDGIDRHVAARAALEELMGEGAGHR